ncbi:MarR family winged helix-turn-helix transcriptional regulator [Luedemannella flava]
MAHEDADRLATELVIYASRLVRAVRRHAGDEVAPETLRLLAQIDQRGPIGITQLAQVENCAQPTMSAAVRLLAEKGWVERAADPRDARASLVALTAAGAAELRRGRERFGRVVAGWFAVGPHTDADLRRAVDLMKSLVAHEAGQ